MNPSETHSYGGLEHIQGAVLALTKMLMESGAQLDAGDAIDQSLSKNEWLTHNASGWIASANKSVVEALEGYLSGLSPSRQEQMLEDENETNVSGRGPPR